MAATEIRPAVGGEMGPEESGALLAHRFQEAAPGDAGLIGVDIETGFPFRMPALNGIIEVTVATPS